MGAFWIKHPWSGGLLWSTLVSALAVTGSLLWQAGYPQWAFLLFFAGLWLLITVCLANDRFNEQSGLILAQVLDANVDQLLDRIHQLEKSIAMMREIQHPEPGIRERRISG